ncbi:MAG: hypothetical protein GTO42_08550 [Candidatus Latescibacteria bacterium]|nr:hypothetical protein [Candidatus Latescibacterota bacterium]NIO29008.1 hypothetical protein [Candidatus Latescibacterota bacterium]NIO56633.1 hypothetical protein [Candidatus Latescibacterota bacterium]NIT02217.1 hypothetical protein [Candidatus Latescibacterota bacterium]NIT39102.1 hypothetical protein [Candidatus Latescibacterota bacterium]
MVKESRFRNALGLKIFLTAVCLVIAISIVIQDYSGYLPSPIFNQNQSLYFACSIIALLISLALLGTVILSKRKHVLFAIFFLFVAFYSCELIVRLFDHFFIDRPSGLIGLYYNHESVILRRPNPTNRMGFNEGYDYSKEIPDNKKRIIFLGDSYTFGSGSTLDKSYCKIVETYLNANGDAKYEVMNAGVPGYSPRESYRLFKFLKKESYQYDAIVLSLFLQNDFTDQIKNTSRKAVCGVIQRFPKNAFLRWFHPLNGYVFRYALVTWVYFKIKRSIRREAEWEQARAAGADDQEESFEVNPITRRRIQANYLKGEAHGFDEVYSSISGIERECGKPFYIVVIPDQFFGDEKIRRQFLSNVDESKYDFLIYYNWIEKHLNEFALLDMTQTIQQCSDCYKRNDMHLNDKGNLTLGEVVGGYLLEQEWVH